MSSVSVACWAVERDPSRLILLGMEPNEPEPEYGYLVLGANVKTSSSLGLRRVARFIEKPQPHMARALFSEGALWNTMVMVGKAGTFLDLVQRMAPGIYSSFERVFKAIGTPSEPDVVEEAYRCMQPLNFSKGLLEPFSVSYSVRLSVLPVRGVVWSDWGSQGRVLNTLRKAGYLARLNGIQEKQLFKIWGGLLNKLVR